MESALRLARLEDVPEDSAIHVRGGDIRKLLFGIDAGASELHIARQLGYDAVIAHHPPGGKAAINYAEVFKRHILHMVDAGVPRAKAEKAVGRKLEQLEVDAHRRNYGHDVDVARLLKMPYMNVHTPLDEVGRRIMGEQVRKAVRGNSTVQDVVGILGELPEFKNATTEIKVRVGKAEDPAGRVVVSHGAGTNGGYEVARAYYEYGVGTVVYIHVDFSDVERLRADGMGNLVVTGHVASDSVGINPFLHELEREGVSITTLGVVPDRVK
jgi:putative NIF3 family GTP cyclohydrolase 1 type 2